MGYSSNPALIAGGSILPSVFVKLSSVADFTALQAGGVSDALIGISMEGNNYPPGVSTATIVAANAGEQLRIYSEPEVCMLTSGSNFTAGTYLTTDTQGRGIPASSGNRVGAIALEASVATNNLVRVKNMIFDL